MASAIMVNHCIFEGHGWAWEVVVNWFDCQHMGVGNTESLRDIIIPFPLLFIFFVYHIPPLYSGESAQVRGRVYASYRTHAYLQ